MAKQNPVMRLCGKIHSDSFINAYFSNTYHVPIWYEYVGNYIQGKEYSGLLSVKTAGDEKYWFTFQIIIQKGVIQCIPYVIFEGEYIICCMNYFFVIRFI